jgi:Retrotransposon gag protein/Zinc knuckle/WCCH motif
MSTSGKATESNESKLKNDIRVEFFHGERAKLRAYLMQVKLVHALDPSKYASETNKVLLAATYLRGDAQSWFEPYFSKFLDGDDDEEAKRTFSKFAYYENKLKQVFGSADEERVATRQIRQLRQKGSAAQYYSRFQQLSARLDWDDSALTSAYYEGLSEQVKDEMGIDPPQTLKKLVEVSIKTDGWLYERRMEKKGGYSGYTGHTGWLRNRSFGRQGRDQGDPMDLSLMERGRSSRPDKPRFGGRGQGGNKEREKRRRDNLCFNCGKSGHRARECKGTAQGLHMMCDDTGIEEKKADTSMEISKTDDSRDSAQKGLVSPDELLQMAMEAVEKDLMALRGTLQDIKDTETPETVQEGTSGDQAWLDGEVPFRPLFKKITTEESHRHALLSWTVCYQDYCPVHYSSKNDSGWFPREPQGKGKQADKDQESLSMMNEEQPAEETSENNADNEQANEESSSDESEPREIPMFIAQRTTKEGFTLVTNFWRNARCQNGRCEINRQHTHTVFDPKAEYKRNPQAIQIRFCQDEECEHKDSVHAHQGNDDEVMEMEIPKEVIERVWGKQETSSLSMMNDNAVSQLVMDERVEKQYMSRDFYCFDIACPYYMMTHQHARNIDPDHPEWGFTPEQFQAMLEVGMTCEDERCQWNKEQHVHTALIGTQSLASMDDKPLCVWPYIDERADARYMSKEQECVDIDCPVYYTEHHHLRNIDPKLPDWGFRSTHYQAMIDDGQTCEDSECQWTELHVHYGESKNAQEMIA